MRKLFTGAFFLILGFFQNYSNELIAKQWKPDDAAAIFSIKPNKVLESSYLLEVLNTYGFIGFAYSSFTGDPHIISLQNEMGVQIKDATEVSLVMGNFLETVQNMPVSTSGNFKVFEDFPLTMILRVNGEISPDTIFEKFDRWASGPFYHQSMIERFRKDGSTTAEEIDEMSRKNRLKKELYASMQNSEKVGKTTMFAIPMGMLDQVLQNKELEITLGIQAEKGASTFAFGRRDKVLAFFDHENQFNTSISEENGKDQQFASFSIPFDEGTLQKIKTSKLSEPNGPLGPLAISLGDAMYQIREVSGTSAIMGGRAHLDLTLRCADAQSAQAIWSIGQATLGMAQLTAMRQRMKNPQTQPLLPLEFLNKIKLKYLGNGVFVHFDASPVELFPWAANKKTP